MPTFAGFSVSPIVTSVPPSLSSNVSTAFYTRDFAHKAGPAEFTTTTTLVNNTPIERQPHATMNGTRFTSYFDIFYNRIHINPPALSLGNLLSAQVRTVELFNAFFTPVDVTAFVSSGLTTGIGVVPPSAPPYTLAPLEAVTYQFSISLSGPPSVSASYEWTIEGLPYTLPVVGNRVLVFPFQPNWADGIKERLQWLTHTHESYTQNEYRYGRRSKPRQFFEVSHMLQGNAPVRLRNLLLGWQSRLYALPDWTSETFTTGPSVAGSYSVSADPSFGSFYPGSLAVILAGDDLYEALEIDSVTSTSIVFTTPLSANWPKHSRVMPANLARILIGQSLVDMTEGVVTAKMAWACDPVDTDPWLPVAASPLDYNAKELWLNEPNWRDNLESSIKYSANVLDFDQGAVNTEQIGPFVPIVYPHLAYLNGKQAIADFRAFALRRKGMLNEFWYPSFRRDFELTADIPSGGTGFQAKTTFDATLLRDFGTHDYVAIFKKDGSVLTFPISDVTNVTDTLMNVTIGGTIGTALKRSAIKRVSYLHYARLDTDEMSFDWKSPKLAEASFTVTALKAP